MSNSTCVNPICDIETLLFSWKGFFSYSPGTELDPAMVWPSLLEYISETTWSNLLTWDYKIPGFILGTYITWYFFFRPFNVFRDFTEFGFENIPGSENNATKRDMINQCIRRRKGGELPPPYPNGWFAILETDQLPRKCVKEVNVLGMNLVAWRGETGKCFLADAYCPHLGAHLGTGGTVSGDCIQCPFHGWVFEGCSGKLRNIPYADSLPDSANLKTHHVLERYGFIYMWHHADQIKPTWEPENIPEIDTGSWRYRGRSELIVSCHIQEIPENGADPSHLDVVHKSPYFIGTCPEKSRFNWNIWKHGWAASWSPNQGKEAHEARLLLHHHFRLFDNLSIAHVDVNARQIGPAMVLMFFDTIVGKGVLVQNITPIEPLLQRVTHRFYSAFTFVHPLGIAVLHSEAMQITRDIRIWNRKTYIRNPILTKEDKLIKIFRRWYSQFYSESSQPFRLHSANTSLDF